MTMPDETTVAALAEVLAEHRHFGYGCTCGWLSDDISKTSRDDHLTHLARELLASPALAELLRGERVRAWDEGFNYADSLAHLEIVPCHSADDGNPYRAEREASQ